MKNRNLEMAQMFKAFSDENRIKIIQMLLKGEMCAADILEELDVTQPTLSHHMKTLCESGVVQCRKSGKWMYYRISKTDCRLALEWLGELMNADEKTAKEEVKKPTKKAKAAPKKNNIKRIKAVPETKPVKVEEPVETPRRRDVDIVIL